jgi:hypothetical protein
MPKPKHDAAKKMIEQLGATLSRVASQKSEGKHEQAIRELRDAHRAIFGDLAKDLAGLDAHAAAHRLGSRRRIGVYAALLGEEADLARRAGRPDQGEALYRRALALQLESLEVHADGAEQTRMAIRALRAKLADEDPQ